MGDHEPRTGARNSHQLEPAPGSGDAPEVAAAHARMVIVPRRPGLLREYEPQSRRPRDEFDDLIDELFGPTTNEKPGRFDAGLVVLGLGFTVWAVVLGGSSVALWIGIAAIVLGIALPARAVFRRLDWSPTGGLRRRIVDRGLPLDASHPATVALIDAYARLIQMICLQGTGDPKRAVSAGHMALMEVASRLDGRPPDTPAKVRFVSLRTDALEAHTRRMLRSHDRWAAQTAMDSRDSGGIDAADISSGSDWRSLDAVARSGAIAQLEKLNAELQKDVAGGSG